MLAQTTQANWRSNPLLFVRQVLDDSPRWSAQRAIFESVRDHRNTLVKSPHGMGKSFCAKDVALWFLFSFPMSIVITTAPSWPQVEKILWAEINNAISGAKMQSSGLEMLRTNARFSDKWFAIGLSPKIESADQAARITGFHAENMLIIFDEGPSINAALWKYKETLMTSANCKFLAIGNPIRSDGDFYEAYQNTANSRISIDLFSSPNFVANGIDSLDKLEVLVRMQPDEREVLYSSYAIPAPYLTTPMWSVDRALDWGMDSPVFEARVLGEFPRKVTDTIISYSECEAAMGAEPKWQTGRCLGVDIARFGDDATVIYGYEDGYPTIRESFQGQDLVKTANRIKGLIRQGYMTVAVDDTGLGGGVTDILRDFDGGAEIIAVNFAAAAYNDTFSGLPTEMYFRARDLIRDGKVRLNDDNRLFGDLSGRKYIFDNRGRFQIEKKADFKKRTGHSPDDGDAFVLCCWAMCRPRSADIALADGYMEKADVHGDFAMGDGES